MMKAVVRQRLKERRSHLLTDEAFSLSISLQERFLDSPLYGAAATIAAYSSFMGEVETSLLLRRAIEDGKRVAMPKLAKEHASMDFMFIEGEDCLSVGAYGIKEPLWDKGKIAEKRDIDLFIIPGVAYDLMGHRIGMGKGYYDRALAGVNMGKLVGFAYDFQVLKEVSSEAHDIRVGTVITEKRVINIFNNI